MHWKKFQEVAAQSFRQIGCVAEEDISVKGARAEHDVDVLVTFDSYGFKVKWILECKAWNTNIPKEKVLALKSIVEDVGADKGLIICKNGFQPGAIKSAVHTNIELVSLDELKRVIASSIIPFISFPRLIPFATSTEVEVSDVILKNLRSPNMDTHPDIYREYLLSNGCQRTQRAAAKGLSKIHSTDSVVLLVERLGIFWGMGAIESSIDALVKLAEKGSVLGMLSTLFLDSRFYYEKIEASAKALKATGDIKSHDIFQGILNSKLSKGMDMSYRLSKKVPNDIQYLANCSNDEVTHGLVLAAFFNQSIWAEKVLVEGAIDESIEYAEETIPGLVTVISNIDLTKLY
jgi:Restriction endonuclease